MFKNLAVAALIALGSASCSPFPIYPPTTCTDNKPESKHEYQVVRHYDERDFGNLVNKRIEINPWIRSYEKSADDSYLIVKISDIPAIEDTFAVSRAEYFDSEKRERHNTIAAILEDKVEGIYKNIRFRGLFKENGELMLEEVVAGNCLIYLIPN